MYLCPRARAAPFISRFCRRSTYTLRTLSALPSYSCLSLFLFLSRNLFLSLSPPGPFFVPRHLPRRPPIPLLRVSHSTSSSFVSPHSPIHPHESDSRGMRTPRNTTSRAKIHRDFNTFNSFIIRFAPTPRVVGNAGDKLHSTSPSLPLSLFLSLSPSTFKDPAAANCSCDSRRQLQPENGCISRARARSQ